MIRIRTGIADDKKQSLPTLKEALMKHIPGWLRMFSALVVLSCVLVSQAGGQVTYGSLTGTVFDSSGAAVAHAKNLATPSATNTSYKTETSAGGIYSLP